MIGQENKQKSHVQWKDVKSSEEDQTSNFD